MKKHILDLNDEQFDSLLGGSEAVFRLVFERYYRSLYHYSCSMLKDEFEAEEVVQNAFIQLHRSMHGLENASGIYPYLFTITKRLVISAFRKKVVEAKRRDLSDRPWTEACNHTHESLQQNDLQQLLIGFVDQLPDKQKEIYMLNKIQGYSYEEIAKVTGNSKNTIRNQLITASKKIRLQIAKYYLLFIF